MNKNTKRARSKKWASMKDMEKDGVKVFAGSSVDTNYPCERPATKRKSPHVYPTKLQ